MRQSLFLAVLFAFIAPVAAGSMEALGGGIAKSALDMLPSAALHPSLALLGAAFCGIMMLERSNA